MSSTDTTYARPWTGLRRKPSLTGEPVKRAVDVAGALMVLLFSAPLLLTLCLLIAAQGGSPLFGHARIGRGGRRFKCWKLRTMVPNAQERLTNLLATDAEARLEWARDHKLRRDPRITPLGRFLRASSFDELPQMLNVLAGEMTLVGPRPIVEAEAARYGRRYKHYLSVTPGVTGLWQVSGRSRTSYRRRVAIDTVYARRRNLLMDLRIIVATVPAVIMSRGAA